MAIFRNKVLRVIPYLTLHQQSMLSQLCIIALGVLIAFIQNALFHWFSGTSFAWFTTPLGLLSLLCFFIFFSELTFILVNVSAFAFWQCAKKLGGQGTFFETSIALLWTLVYTLIPFGLFVLLLDFDELLGIIIHSFSCIGIVVSGIYGLVTMIKKLSEIHRISSDRAFVVFFIGSSSPSSSPHSSPPFYGCLHASPLYNISAANGSVVNDRCSHFDRS